MSWPARFPGTCPGCGFPIEVGDTIERAGETYVHKGCTVSPVPVSKVGEVCPRCFLERALDGSCGCDSD